MSCKPDLKKLLLPGDERIVNACDKVESDDYRRFLFALIDRIEKLEASAVEVFTEKDSRLYVMDRHICDTHRTWIFPQLTEEIKPARVTKEEIPLMLRAASGLINNQCPLYSQLRELADRIEKFGVEG